jgi:hypothetical protein
MSIGCIDAGKPPSFESEVLFLPEEKWRIADRDFTKHINVI